VGIVVGVSVIVGIVVAVGTNVLVGTNVGVRVSVGVLVNMIVGVGVRVGVFVGVGEGVGEGEGVCVAVLGCHVKGGAVTSIAIDTRMLRALSPIIGPDALEAERSRNGTKLGTSGKKSPLISTIRRFALLGLKPVSTAPVQYGTLFNPTLGLLGSGPSS
jgi:hypothetical protein